jgi:hypothetical protein
VFHIVKLLDARTSQNASYANSISNPVSTTPELAGQLTLSLAGATGLIRVQFDGIVGLKLPTPPVATTVTVTVVRGTTMSDLIIFTGQLVMDTSILGPQNIAFTASDFNVPPTSPITYTMFISASALGTTRVGPESFNATAYSD